MEMTDKHMNEIFFEEVPVDELYGNAQISLKVSVLELVL